MVDVTTLIGCVMQQMGSITEVSDCWKGKQYCNQL